MTAGFSPYRLELQLFTITGENQMLLLLLPRAVCVR